MMIDYHVSDHWSPHDPDWLKALVSSLDRRSGTSSVLPLPLVVSEIAEWVKLASGVEAWAPRKGRASLETDLRVSRDAMGPSLSTLLTAPLSVFESAFAQLITSSRPILEQPPAARTDATWSAMSSAAADLLVALTARDAVQASWDDLVATAQDRTLARREYRPIAELLHEQLQRRGHSADRIFDELVSIVAFGRDAGDVPLGANDTPIDGRLTKARDLIGTPAKQEPTVVWLGYKGRVRQRLEAGRVTFYDAHWTVPNADPHRFDFPHKEELWKLVQYGHTFRVARRIDEESDVDTLVRVDLGTRTAAGAIERAAAIVDVILSVSIHRAGGTRPQLTQSELLRSGRQVGGGRHAIRRDGGFPDDSYGASITSEAIVRHGPRIAEALAREELPRFLAAAIEVQTTADHPFSRDMALRKPSEADINSVISLTDRVVQHVAAHAAITPDSLFAILGARWPHSRWLSDLQTAAHMCLLGLGNHRKLLDELTREWMSDHSKQPWILLLADRAEDFLLLCRLDHERAWISRMFASVTDHAIYRALIEEYDAEGSVLDARRRRVRNALAHGNPTSPAAVKSVIDYVRFLSSTALSLAIESFVTGTPPLEALEERTDEFAAMTSGQDAATYWRERIAHEGWPPDTLRIKNQ